MYIEYSISCIVYENALEFQILSGIEVENRRFRTLHCDCRPTWKERPAIST